MPVFIENGKHNNEILIVIQYGRWSYRRNVDLFDITNNSISTNTSSFATQVKEQKSWTWTRWIAFSERIFHKWENARATKIKRKWTNRTTTKAWQERWLGGKRRFLVIY